MTYQTGSPQIGYTTLVDSDILNRKWNPVNTPFVRTRLALPAAPDDPVRRINETNNPDLVRPHATGVMPPSAVRAGLSPMALG